MAKSLLTISQNVAQKIGRDNSFTSFSDNDETNLIVQFVNEAYEDLIQDLPDDLPFLQASGTITTANGTRTYSIASDAFSPNLMVWSFENETQSDGSVRWATEEWCENQSSTYDEDSGEPTHVYATGNNLVGFYPVPDAVYSIKYEYKKYQATRLSATTDTFMIPDPWLRYIEEKAAASYMSMKRFADGAKREAEAFRLYANIMAEADDLVPSYLDGDPLY